MAKGLLRSLKRSQMNARANDFVKLTLPVRGLVVNISDPGAANGFGSAVMGDLPNGDILLLGAIAYFRFTKLTGGIADAFAGNFAIGTAPTADATLAAGEVDIVQSQAFTTAVGGVSAYTRYTPSTSSSLSTVINNRDGSLELNLNMFITDATLTALGTLKADGVLHLAYCHLGDD